MGLLPPPSATTSHVSHVLLMSAPSEMLDVDTGGIVAGVQDIETALPLVMGEDYSVGVKGSAVGSDLPVATHSHPTERDAVAWSWDSTHHDPLVGAGPIAGSPCRCIAVSFPTLVVQRTQRPTMNHPVATLDGADH